MVFNAWKNQKESGMMRTATRLVLPTLLVLCLSCSSDSPSGPGPAGDDWILGEATTTPIALEPGGFVDEPISGGVLVFPAGGAGTLVVTEILDGPSPPPYPGVGIRIEYDGDEPLWLGLPDTGEEAVVLGWGTSSGSIHGAGAVEDRWISLPRLDATSFQLVRPFELSDKRTNRRGYTNHHIATIPAGSDAPVRLVAVRAQANQDIQSWITALPANQQAAMRIQVAANPPEYYADEDYYIGFVRYQAGVETKPMIGLRPAADEHTTAHEVGHYMHHMLIGDPLYLDTENRVPDAHAIGEVHPGCTTIGEDIAYFSQFLLRGSVNNYDPTEPGHLIQGRHPRTHDYPCIEGFATCLLARLWSADATIGAIHDMSQRSPVPVVGLSMADVLSIISLGARTIDELLEDITTYLAGVGKADVLPILLERLGWRYQVRVRLVDPSGAPLRNTPVEKIAVADLTEYHPWIATATTDDDGYIEDNAFFPLDSILRVDYLGRTIDVPVRVDPALPTNQRVDLGTLTVGDGLDLSLVRFGKIRILLHAEFDDWNGVWETPWSYDSKGFVGGTVSGGVFSGSADYVANGWRYQVSLSVTVDPESGASSAYRLVVHATALADDTFDHYEVAGGDVPFFWYELGDGTVSYVSYVHGPGTCECIDEASRTNLIGGVNGSMTGYSCNANSLVQIWLSSENE